jgi:hypothetical protein
LISWTKGESRLKNLFNSANFIGDKKPPKMGVQKGAGSDEVLQAQRG